MPGVILMHAVYDNPSQPSADTAITTHHFEVPITPPSTTDTSIIVAAWQTFWEAIDQYIANDYVNTQLRFYNVPPGANPTLGEPFHVDETDRPGTEPGDMLPPQVALSVTEETAIRRRWGRFYLPGMTEQQNGPTGRPAEAMISAVADAAHDFYETVSAGARPGVVYRRADGSYQLVRSIRVDDVWDIIRRRRYSFTNIRQIRSISD